MGAVFCWISRMSNVNLYSALSLKTPNALYTLTLREQERLQRLSENVVLRDCVFDAHLVHCK